MQFFYELTTLVSPESSRTARKSFERLGVWGPVKLIILRFFQKILAILTGPYDQVVGKLGVIVMLVQLKPAHCVINIFFTKV